ncbi:hypothetical protein [Phenylobacterium sp.]|uniref:hypothetical protein n=1 Tax=Phenylobacterium sp. TaxID=1871053 RepID=UPI0025E1C884|nr:hypothetical protein [Phenylobacterium sp.]
MIQTHEQFEAALDAATHVLEDPPEPATPAHERLMALLKDIAAYRPQIQAPAEADDDGERARLAKRLEEFESKVAPRYEHEWRPMLGDDIWPERA